LVKLTVKIQSDIKYNGTYKKQMLIDAFKYKLPESIWKRPKMGFAFPFKDWLINNDLAKEQIASYQKLKNGSMHWSQFLTLLLIENHGEA
jgi:asparagine synthase (glutamine-hydrolysing)